MEASPLLLMDMNWQKISAIVSVLAVLVGAICWFSTNVVFASDFNQYQTLQQERWLQYDSDMLWRKYPELRSIPDKSPFEQKQLQDIERDMLDIQDKIKAIRSK